MDKKLVLVEKRGRPEAAIFKIGNNTRFALLNSKNEQVMSAVSCKAFLEEVVWSFKTKNKVPRTDFNAEVCMFDTKVSRMSVEFPTQISYKFFIKNLETLNSMEILANIKPTTFHKVTKKNTVIVIGDKNWVNYVWKVGVWAFLIKMCSYKSFDVARYPEGSYWKEAQDTIGKILSKVPKKHTEIQEDSASLVHIRGSISGLNKGVNKNTRWILA